MRKLKLFTLSKANGLKWAMLIIVVSIMVTGYGGLCTINVGSKSGSSSSSESAKSVISGQAYQQTSDNNMVPLGGATVTVSYSDTTRSFGSKTVSNHSKTTRTKSDGSYEITDIPPDRPVTVTITSADTIQSTETITATAGVNNSSAILKGKGKKIGLIKKNQNSILNTFDDDTMPKCQVSIPADAVSSDVDNVYLTSTHQGENLSSLPDGYIFLAGADFATSSPITFTSGKEATPYIILPPNVQAEDLSTADIKLMEFIDGNWVITTPSGKGKVFTTGNWAGYIGPDDTEPAKLKGVRPFAWVKVQPSIATINGTIRNTSGTPIKGVFVFGGGAKTYTKSDGAYTLKNVSVIKTNTLIPVNATADDYQLSNQFVSLSPGATVNNVDFVLEPITVAQLGEVYGKVTNSGDSSAIYGALLTLQTNPSIRGMKYDNKNTPTDLTDDTFYVVPPSGINITNYKWMLTFPNGMKFNSAVENGASVVLNQLATESGINSTGAYKVELEVTYSGGNKTIVSGGFLLRQSGLVLYIADVRLPLSLQDQLTLKAMTNETGDYRFINLPTGETFNLWVKYEGFIAPNTVQITALTSGERKQQNFPLSALTTDTENPTNPSAFTGTARSAFSILLTWSASTDNVGIDYYRVYRGTSPVEIAKTTGTSYIDSGLTPNTLYTYQIGAFDKANNSALSTPINVTTLSDTTTTDNTKPSTPTNLAASVIGPTQINLTWGASTDNVGVIGYYVYRSTDGASYPVSYTGATTSYSNNGLTANTPYWYKVSAYDAAGNISAYSNVVTGTTPAVADTTPPSVPRGLVVTAVSSGQINLIWNPSTDTGGSGLAGYKLYRSTDGTNYQQLTTINSTSYSNSGLSASTLYYYKVAAYDGAGNTSAQSSAANATTQAAGGGGQLVAHWKFDEGTGTTAGDASGNGNNGTVYGATWSGGALSFDGVDDYINVPDSSNLNPTNQLTIEAWCKPNNVTGNHDIVSRHYDEGTAKGTLVISDGKIKFYINVGGTCYYVTSVSTISVGTWYYVVATYNGSSIKIYINGVLDSSVSATGSITTNSIPTMIGTYAFTCSSEMFSGLLDDVRIYNYARSAGDILAEYNAVYKPIKTVTFGDNLRGVAFDPIYNKVYVASWPDGASWVYAVSATNYTLETTITSQNDNHGAVAVSSDGKYIYTVNYYGGSVTRFDRDNSYAKTTLGLGSWANALKMSPDGSKLYVMLGNDGRAYIQDTGSKIAVVDTATFTLIEYINLPEATYGESWQLVVSPDGTKIYITAGKSNGSVWTPWVHTISLATKTVIASMADGRSIGSSAKIAITPNGQFLYVSDTPNNRINILSTADLSLQYSISVGRGPDGIAVSPDGNTVLVGNTTDKTISQIDVSSRTVVKVIPAADMIGEIDITFNPTGNYAYAVNRGTPGSLLVLARTSDWQLNTPFNPASQDQVVATVNGIHGSEFQSQAVESFNGKIYYSVRGDGTSTPWKVYSYNPVNNENSTVISSTADSYKTTIKSMKGNLYISHNSGKLWKYDGSTITEVTGTPFSSTNYVFAMCEFNNKMYFGTSDGNIYESTDLTTFTSRMHYNAKAIIDLAVWKGCLYASNGEGYSYSSKIFRSANGIDWSVMGTFNTFELGGFVATPDYLYVSSVENASGPSFAIRSSTDGATWNRFLYTTSEGKISYGRPCYFSQTGRVYYAAMGGGIPHVHVFPCYNGSAESTMHWSHEFVSFIEVNGRLFGIGSQSPNPNVYGDMISPTVISILGNYAGQ